MTIAARPRTIPEPTTRWLRRLAIALLYISAAVLAG